MRSNAESVFPIIVPSLIEQPITPFKANALATLSSQAGNALNSELETILSAQVMLLALPSWLTVILARKVIKATLCRKSKRDVCAMQHQLTAALALTAWRHPRVQSHHSQARLASVNPTSLPKRHLAGHGKHRPLIRGMRRLQE